MAQQGTFAASSGTTPKTKQDAFTAHIHVIVYIEAIRDHDVLDKYDTSYRARKNPDQAVQRALWGGVCALNMAAHRNLRDAKQDGLLLMCWEGSKVVELAKGGAA